MKKYKENGKRIVEVSDLSYLKDKAHPYGWLKRHFLHFRLKYALYRADSILAADAAVATDLVRYYFVSKEKISVRPPYRSADKA